MTRYLVTGGAGFIGSHVTRRLAQAPDARVVVFDNLCSGRREHLDEVMGDGRVEIVLGDLKDLDALVAAAEGVDHAFHFAANPDIAKAMAEPSVDFWEGTYLTQNLLEALRRNGVTRLTYASGSGVYGDVGELPVVEDMILRPVSPYGASKLACEAMIGTYCHMFEHAGAGAPLRERGGPPADPRRRLRLHPPATRGARPCSRSWATAPRASPTCTSTTSWTPSWVSSPTTGRRLRCSTSPPRTTSRCARSPTWWPTASDCRTSSTASATEPRGWKGDVPVVRFDSGRARARGWSNARTSREAMAASIDAMIMQLDAEQAERASP